MSLLMHTVRRRCGEEGVLVATESAFLTPLDVPATVSEQSGGPVSCGNKALDQRRGEIFVVYSRASYWPNFKLLNAGIASSLNEIIQNSCLKMW